MARVLMTTLRKARERVNRKAFSALFDNPVSGTITLPAGARLSFVPASPVLEGVTLATVAGSTSRTVKSPGLEAGERLVLDYAERATVVTAASGVVVEIDNGLGRWVKIGEGS